MNKEWADIGVKRKELRSAEAELEKLKLKRLELESSIDPFEQFMRDRDIYTSYFSWKKWVKWAWKERFVSYNQASEVNEKFIKKLKKEWYDSIIIKWTEYDSTTWKPINQIVKFDTDWIWGFKAKASANTATTPAKTVSKVEAVNKAKTQKLIQDSVDEWNELARKDRFNEFENRPYTKAEIAEQIKGGYWPVKYNDFKIKSYKDFKENFEVEFHWSAKNWEWTPTIQGSTHWVWFWTTPTYKTAKQYGDNVKIYTYRNSDKFSKWSDELWEYQSAEEFNMNSLLDAQLSWDYKWVQYYPKMNKDIFGVRDFETAHFNPKELVEIKLPADKMKLLDEWKLDIDKYIYDNYIK